jgi:hypothetical protein
MGKQNLKLSKEKPTFLYKKQMKSKLNHQFILSTKRKSKQLELEKSLTFQLALFQNHTNLFTKKREI